MGFSILSRRSKSEDKKSNCDTCIIKCCCCARSSYFQYRCCPFTIPVREPLLLMMNCTTGTQWWPPTSLQGTEHRPTAVVTYTVHTHWWNYRSQMPCYTDRQMKSSFKYCCVQLCSMYQAWCRVPGLVPYTRPATVIMRTKQEKDAEQLQSTVNTRLLITAPSLGKQKVMDSGGGGAGGGPQAHWNWQLERWHCEVTQDAQTQFVRWTGCTDEQPKDKVPCATHSWTLATRP